MSGIVERARRFDGGEAYSNEETLVRIPAARLLEFCKAELGLGNEVEFVECLYLFGSGGIQPSMELSSDRADFNDTESFLAFVSKAALQAVERAREKLAVAFFEVGVRAT